MSENLTTKAKSSPVIESVFEDGYWWVQMDDKLWENATITYIFEGYPLRIKY